MKYFYACCTDTGIVRKVNQDTFILKRTQINGEKAILAAVCDGIGGLSQGEEASRKVVEHLDQWFGYEFSQLALSKKRDQAIMDRCTQLVQELNQEIYIYGCEKGIQLGTTLTLMLFYLESYYIIHIGDSRAYEIASEILQLTTDHSWAARQIANGRMTWEEIQQDKRKNMIYQCIGVTEQIQADIFMGNIRDIGTYLICTDGFWRHMGEDELYRLFAPETILNETILQDILSRSIENVKKRGETDNITVIAIQIKR